VQSKVVGKVSFFCWMFFTIAVGAMLAATVQLYCFGVLGQNLARRIRRLMLRSIMYQVSQYPLTPHLLYQVGTARLALTQPPVPGRSVPSRCSPIQQYVTTLPICQPALRSLQAMPSLYCVSVLWHPMPLTRQHSGTMHALAKL
jgi:hypothetical protein